MANILTPDQRLRVFVSSTLQELASERKAVMAAIEELRLSPVMFELGARPHPPRALYRTYLEQSHIFVGIYWQSYGWVAPGEQVSGLEDEYRLAARLPKLIYVKTPAAQRAEALGTLLAQVRADDQAAYKSFRTARELKHLVKDDLAVLLSESFVGPERTAEDVVQVESTRPATLLPLPLSGLIGRKDDVANANAILQNPEVRLVTFLGPGGVGKTRLALEVASQLQDSCEDGVFFVLLSIVRDSEQVVPAIADAVGLSEKSGPPILEQLKRYLLEKRVLLLIDNFEHVVQAAPILSELMAAAPALRLVVTSRTALRLTGEYIFDVQPLTLPDHHTDFEATRHADAVRLFVVRAQATFPRFTLTPENAPIVADICRRLDGLPLAIELAAAQSRMLSPQTLLNRLDRRFELLRDGARDLSLRQQTLRDTLDWSYELLGPTEKELFAALAVFNGGFSLEAAESVCSEIAADVLEPLASLLDNSFLRPADAAGELRYFMLESIHQYALEKLEASESGRRVRQRHADFFLTIAQRAQPHLMGDQQADWLEELDRDRDNFRAALTLTAEVPETGLLLAIALFRFWLIRGLFSEGRHALAQALALTTKQDAARAEALHAASVLARAQGDYQAARALLEENLSLAYTLEDKRNIAAALSNLGVVNQEQHDYESARSLLERSLLIRRELGDTRGAIVSLINLGNTIYQQGEYPLAQSLLEDGLAQGREVGDKYVIATVLDSLGVVARARGEVDRQKSFYEESLKVSRELGDKLGVALTLCNLGELAIDQNELTLARSYLTESLTLQLEVQDQRGISFLLDEFGHLLAAEGDFRRATELCGAAEALRDTIQVPLSEAERSQHTTRIAALRRELGETTFIKCWQKGQAVNPGSMITWALKAKNT